MTMLALRLSGKNLARSSNRDRRPYIDGTGGPDPQVAEPSGQDLQESYRRALLVWPR